LERHTGEPGRRFELRLVQRHELFRGLIHDDLLLRFALVHCTN
jgi:hypothetical protein